MNRVKAVEVDPPHNNILAAGEFYFINRDGVKRVGIIHSCPCGCTGLSAIFFRGMGAGQQEWDVTGEWPNVTLSPSIGIRYDGKGCTGPNGGYHWHGYLRNGWFEEC